MNLKEAKLAELIFEYFKDKGFKVYSEYSIYYRPVDFIAYNEKELIAIELKTSLTKKVIQQASSCRNYVDLVYIVVGTNPNKSSLEKCISLGIGVISLKDSIVKELAKPLSDNYTNENKRMQIIKEISCLEESNDAGKPNLKEGDPAQSIKIQVKELRKKGKSWKEIYNLIPNHYSSYKSLQSSMSLLEDRERMNEYVNKEKESFEETLREYLILISDWDNDKSFLSNKRKWLDREGDFIYGAFTIKMINSYKHYKQMNGYLNSRISFYNKKCNLKRKEEFLRRIKINKYLKIEDTLLDEEETISILKQEKKIQIGYLPLKDKKIINDDLFSSVWL